MDHFYALIMAGGGGTRLWPLSRHDRPKQALALTEERTLIQVTVERLNSVIAPDHIYIVASAELCALLHEYVPQLPRENLIVEPSARNSGPAAALGTYQIAARDADAIIAVLSADHHIADESVFQKALRAACEYAEKGFVITIGITPDHPSTGFGYIRREEKIGDAHDLTVYRAGGFREKPDAATAESFLRSGLYSWNAGMFIWGFQTIRAEFQRQHPEMAHALTQITHKNITDTARKALWETVPALSIDYLIMENAHNVMVIPAEMGWSDVGVWSALYDLLPKDAAGNAARTSGDRPIHIETTGALTVGKRLIVTIGLEDVVIIETDDAILVCKRDRTQDVRRVVDLLRGEQRTDLL